MPKANPKHNLAYLYPQIAKEWHPTLNETDASDVAPFSTQLRWWQCSKDPAHVWKAPTVNRTKLRGRCRICPRTVGWERSLAFRYPHLLAEWDYELNEGSNPSEIAGKTERLFFWKCEVGHSWKTRILTRLRDTSCPECRKKNKK